MTFGILDGSIEGGKSRTVASSFPRRRFSGHFVHNKIVETSDLLRPEMFCCIWGLAHLFAMLFLYRALYNDQLSWDRSPTASSMTDLPIL